MNRHELRAHGAIKAPNNANNFFGLGNETIFDETNGKGIDYYRTRYNIIEGGLLLRFNPNRKISFRAGPIFQYFNIDSSDNVNRIINSGNLVGVDQATLYDSKLYAGGRLQLDIDLRNNKTITSRGIFWKLIFNQPPG